MKKLFILILVLAGLGLCELSFADMPAPTPGAGMEVCHVTQYLYTYNETSGELYCWTMTDCPDWPIAGENLIAQVDPVWKLIDVRDIDGDGQPDLVWRNVNSGALYVWLIKMGSAIKSEYPLPTTLPDKWTIK